MNQRTQRGAQARGSFVDAVLLLETADLDLSHVPQ